MWVQKLARCAAGLLLVTAGQGHGHAAEAAAQEVRCERARYIVTLFLGAMETARAIETYSKEERPQAVDVLGDAELFKRLFRSTRIDKSNAIWIEELPNRVFEGACFFEAAVAFVSPPERVFSLAVLPTGQILRFRGFERSDGFEELLGRCRKLQAWSAIDVVALFYRLNYADNPGPLVTEEAVRKARRDLVAAGAKKEELAECSLPVLRDAAEGQRVSVTVYDHLSTRLERHEVVVTPDGNVRTIARRVMRNYGAVRM